VLQLHGNPGAITVNDLGQISEAWDIAVIAQCELVVRDITLNGWRRHLDDDQTDATFSPGFKVIDQSLADVASFVVITRAHRGHHNSVLQLHLPYLPLLKESSEIIAHGNFLHSSVLKKNVFALLTCYFMIKDDIPVVNHDVEK
jgi:hypothetical protein